MILSSLILSVSLLFSSQPLSKKTEAQSQKLIKKGLKDERAYKLIESLTTEVGPRLAGTESEERARKWAMRRFKSMGFKNVRTENFPVNLWERVKEEAEVLPPYRQKLRITALGRSVCTPIGGIKGYVARFPSFKALKKAPLKGYIGKIIFVDEPMGRDREGKGYSKAVVICSP